MTFPGASCGLMIAFSTDIDQKLTVINNEKDMNKSDAEILKSVCEVVQFHTVTLQLS